MIRIKNLRGGWLFIPDAGLKLKAGQVASVKSISPQIKTFMDKGYVAQVEISSQKEDAASVAEKKSAPSSKVDTLESDLPPVPAEYRALNSRDSVEFIKKCEDLPLLRAILKKESRKTVLDDLNARIEELESLNK